MFYIQLIISFFIGGLFIGLQTLLAERVSPQLRGIVLTIPASMAIGLFFVGLTKSTADVTEIARTLPSALIADYVFVFVFAVLSRFSIGASLIGGMAAYASSGFIFLSFPPKTFLLSFVPAVIGIFLMYWGVKKLPQIQTLKVFPMNTKHILVRSVIAGSVVVLIIVLAKTMGNTWGALAAAFPATFTSTLMIYYKLQGKAVIPAVARTLFFPGSLGFMLYALVAGLTFPQLGIWLGTLLSYGATFAFFCAYFYLIQAQKPTLHGVDA